jgi:hypothetical protein
VRRRAAIARLSEQQILSRLATSDADTAARALRRYRAWRAALDRHAGAKEQRALRRGWERARDEAMIALAVEELTATADSSSAVRAPSLRSSTRLEEGLLRRALATYATHHTNDAADR